MPATTNDQRPTTKVGLFESSLDDEYCSAGPLTRRIIWSMLICTAHYSDKGFHAAPVIEQCFPTPGHERRALYMLDAISPTLGHECRALYMLVSTQYA